MRGYIPTSYICYFHACGFQEASCYLQALHKRTLVRNYMKRLTPVRKTQLQWKREASDIFKVIPLSFLGFCFDKAFNSSFTLASL